MRAMFYTFCYAQCRASTALNHTDAKALGCALNVRLWHWCGFSEPVIVVRYLVTIICPVK